MTKPREKTCEELQAEIEDGKKKIRQFENREKMLRQKLSKEERRTRSHRLIVRGAVFESVVPEAKNMTDEEAAALLKSTLKEISELLGKETIDSYNQSENRGSQVSHGLNYQKLGKELMTQDEIAVMDGGKCILQLRGVRPFFSDKFDITKHPRYKYLADADKKNTFDIERYMKRRPAIVKPDEPFDLYELNASDLEPDNNNSTKRKEK